MVNSGVNQQKKECINESIIIEGVSKKFGKIQALDDLNLKVDTGTVFALLGPNGSGKTTLVRILTTLLKPDKGTVQVGGYDVIKQANLVRSITGLAGQYPAVDENLTGRENLEMIGNLYHLEKQSCKERTNELLDKFDLIGAGNRRAKTYSGGMRRRLDLAAALIGNPSILFLDEPTTGLDPRSRLGMWEVISDQAKNCSTVFLTTQYLEEADRLATKIAIMDKGKIIRVGSPQELKDCCGGEAQVKIRVLDRSQTQKAYEILSKLGNNKIRSIIETGEISMPALEGTTILTEIIRYLDKAGIAIAELGLKQPTLDDVFLAITGHTAENTNPENLKQINNNINIGK